ncbi:hypothetical protein HanXRQr2_Chr12g0552761 [Helianthus annuus]|uniref:Uncharacterized protein n=1 Tax=Helianthus annuus TaxID=4232 RepID=A0A9K3HI95_HELAN|nr:hypothetical protein HanXRQr2_Chr12g0552761 [Helianthus annuus]KAJ0490224.1 hypothetical protein HanHA300_Chr12g0453021 [Helianthus annuus]KAJ0506143.1 hypothetical protein HanHA89_Chr12g0478611 [Helianthus annuus]KAJ0675814.1 hypothetical protein HanLR1_Chr12g0455511 [Helianthus annuus]KAJ0679072.1 hypothetical protein HanOQP8_Chr12g0455181 [Helianthus annuus]
MISSVFEGLKVIPRSFKQEPSIISSFYSKTHLNLEGRVEINLWDCAI